MSTKKAEVVDIGKAITHFFELEDWMTRVLYIGGFAALLGIMYFVGFFLAFIPIIGWILGCFLFIAVLVGAIAYAFYTQGYMYEILEAVAAGKSVEAVKADQGFSEKIRVGFKIMMANIVYAIPIAVLYFIGYGLFFAPIILLEGSNSESAEAIGAVSFLGSTLLFYLLIFVAMIYQFIMQFVIVPLMLINYHKHKTFGSMFSFGEMWEILKRQWLNILIYAILFFGLGMVLWFLNVISMFLIFLCIGIFLLIAVWAISSTYSLHLTGYLLGQIAKEDKRIKH